MGTTPNNFSNAFPDYTVGPGSAVPMSYLEGDDEILRHFIEGATGQTVFLDNVTHFSRTYSALNSKGETGPLSLLGPQGLQFGLDVFVAGVEKPIALLELPVMEKDFETEEQVEAFVNDLKKKLEALYKAVTKAIATQEFSIQIDPTEDKKNFTFKTFTVFEEELTDEVSSSPEIEDRVA